MTNHSPFRCIKCGKELDNICGDCFDEEIEKAFHQASLEREKTAKKYRLVPIEDDTSEDKSDA